MRVGNVALLLLFSLAYHSWYPTIIVLRASIYRKTTLSLGLSSPGRYIKWVESRPTWFYRESPQNTPFPAPSLVVAKVSLGVNKLYQGQR